MEREPNNVMDCALVLEGGGYRGAFTAGIVSALLDAGIRFDYACGVSAGSSNVANYIAGDQRRIRMAFVDIVDLPGNGGLRSMLHGNGFFNADFLYEGCFEEGPAPFDWEGFQANPARMRIQAFERDTGRSVTFTREDMDEPYALVERVRASSTVPFLMNPLSIDGQVCVDGGLGDGAGLSVHLAERDGFERFFCVMTRVKGYRKKTDGGLYYRIAQRLSAEHPHLQQALATRAERYNAELSRVEALAEEGKAFIVYPDEMPISSTTLDSSKLAAVFDAARAQARRDLPRWREFLFG